MPEPEGGRARWRPRRGDLLAFAIGGLLFFALGWTWVGGLALLKRAECSGESRPFLGSGRQFFEVYGCLARDAGPLIGIKKRLGIYDPGWMPVIK